MTNIARSSLALFVAAALGLLAPNPAQAHLVEDFGIRKGEPAHISLSTGFNGFVGAGIKKIRAVIGAGRQPVCSHWSWPRLRRTHSSLTGRRRYPSSPLYSCPSAPLYSHPSPRPDPSSRPDPDPSSRPDPSPNQGSG